MPTSTTTDPKFWAIFSTFDICIFGWSEDTAHLHTGRRVDGGELPLEWEGDLET